MGMDMDQTRVVTYLPNAEHGVARRRRHGRKLRRRVHRLDLADDAALRDEDVAVGLRHVGQQGHHQWVRRPVNLAQVLGLPHDSFQALPVVCTRQQRHVRPPHGLRRHAAVAFILPAISLTDPGSLYFLSKCRELIDSTHSSLIM
jgi:hypothetical protein